MQQRLPKFERAPERVQGKQITARSLDVLGAVAHFPFVPTSLLVKLVAGNEDVTHRHLQQLWHRGLVARFAFPLPGNPGEFHYYLDNPDAIRLLDDGGVQLTSSETAQVARNREKAYDEIHDRAKASEVVGRMLFLQHEVMVTRFHGMVELACRDSGGKVELASWIQGAPLWSTVDVPNLMYDGVRERWLEDETTERLPHRPDAFFTLYFPNEPEGRNRANFFYEADRKTTNTTRFQRKLRAHFHYIVRQRRHQEAYGIRRVRAVLIETLDTAWAEELRQAAGHPSVSGEVATPLFWFTASEIFTKLQQLPGKTTRPHFLISPDLVFQPVWVSPVDDTLHSLLD